MLNIQELDTYDQKQIDALARLSPTELSKRIYIDTGYNLLSKIDRVSRDANLTQEQRDFLVEIDTCFSQILFMAEMAENSYQPMHEGTREIYNYLQKRGINHD